MKKSFVHNFLILALALIMALAVMGCKSTQEAPSPADVRISLSVVCNDILQNAPDKTADKIELVPEDGIVYESGSVTFTPGESAFDVLLRETKAKGIHMEFQDSNMYNTVYIEGIANIYEGDFGEMSGWTYLVNGQSPQYGASQHILQDGDKVEFVYLCDMMSMMSE